LRRVNLKYQCTICGAEVKMTKAGEELPEAPRHCMEDMQLVAPID
jgi:DNA-directed RNA polymerase subunit RPC12/RpoP